MAGQILAYKGSKYARIMASRRDNIPHDSWLFSPAIECTAGLVYHISFWLQIRDYVGAVDRLNVKIGNSPTANSMTTLLYDNENTPFAGWTLISVDFMPDVTENYHIGFHACSEEYAWFIAIDEIEVVESFGVKTLTPANNSEDVSLDAEVTVTFSENITANDLSGITINGIAVTANVSNDKLMINHADFSKNTQYTVTVPANSINNYDRDIVWSFNTLKDNIGIPAITEEGINIYPNPSNGVVNVSVSENSTVKVFGITGKLLETHFMNANSILHLSQSTGVYFIQIETKGGNSTRKIMINK